jgi:hypothetical protein
MVGSRVAGLRVPPLPEDPRKPDQRDKDGWTRAARELGPYLGVGTSLAATVACGVYVGYKADERWGTTPALTLTGAVLSTVVAMVGFFRTVMTKRQ